jgi:hypothetical protein
MYALDNSLFGTPVATGHAAQWTANGAEGVKAWIPYTLSVLGIFSWILAAFLGAAVVPLLRTPSEPQ